MSHEFRVRVQNLIRSIHDTILAFNEYVVEDNGDLWVPTADRLFSAFERMLRIMRDARACSWTSTPTVCRPPTSCRPSSAW